MISVGRTRVPADPVLDAIARLAPPHEADDVVDVLVAARVVDDATLVVVQVRLRVCS